MSCLIDLSTFCTVLYNSSTGANDTFQLSDSAANYARLKFFFKSNDGDFNSLEVYNPNGQSITTVVDHPITTANYTKLTRWTISGNSVTRQLSIQVANDGNIEPHRYVYIMRVEGWSF